MKSDYGKCEYCSNKAEMQFGFFQICRPCAEKPAGLGGCLQFVAYAAGVCILFCFAAWFLSHVAAGH